MDFSPASLIAGFVFGIFGFYALKQGRKDANARKIILGLALMVYSYLVSNPWMNWGIGIVLTILAYRE